MAYADITYTGDASTLVFNIPFSYINESHLVFYVGGVSTADGSSLYTATVQTGGTTVEIKKTSDNSAVPDGTAVKIERNTPINTPSVVFSNSSTLKATDLNTEVNQLLYSAQETADDAGGKINLDATGHWGADSKKIRSMADPVDAQDAVTKNYLETTWLSAADKANINAISPYSTQLGLLGTADAVADMNTLGTADVVADMNTLGTADVVSDMNTLGTADVVSDMNLLATADVINDMNTLATADVVADMALLGTADVVSDMNTLATADVISDMNTLATADIVSDMNTLGTADVVSDMDTLATASNVTNMDTAATNIGSINTCATNISDIQAASSAAGLQTVDNFSGDGSTTAFTLSAAPSTENNTAVYVDGVYQQKNTYSISSTTLTFSEAPPTGTNNIEVMQLSTQPTGVNPTVAATNTTAAGSSASVSASGHALTFNIPRGDTGATGPQGNVGTAATIAAGSTTTGAPGTSASVTNSGSSSAATFDFTIPRGDVGATGPQGAQGIQGIQGPQGDTGAAGSVSGMADGSAAAPSLAFSSDTDTGLYRGAANQLGFTTAGTSAMTIDASQNVVIGAADINGGAIDGTTIGGSTAAAGAFTTLDVQDSIDLTGASVDSDLLPVGDNSKALGSDSLRWSAVKCGGTVTYGWGSAGAPALCVSAETTTGLFRAASNAIGISTAGAERVRIDAAGDFGIGETNPTHKLHVGGDIYATGNVTAYSSAVAKDNIETIPDALDIVEKLRGVSFDWKDSGKKSVGLIYEEVKEVIPELTSNNGGHVGVAYQNTVAVLIEAVKSLSAKVKELEAK